MHIAKIGEKREKTFNFSPFCGIINYIKKKTNLIQMLDFTVFVHISKCIKIVQVKRRIPEEKIVKNTDEKELQRYQKIRYNLTEITCRRGLER